jgi:hypothetical protein
MFSVFRMRDISEIPKWAEDATLGALLTFPCIRHISDSSKMARPMSERAM